MATALLPTVVPASRGMASKGATTWGHLRRWWPPQDQGSYGEGHRGHQRQVGDTVNAQGSRNFLQQSPLHVNQAPRAGVCWPVRPPGWKSGGRGDRALPFRPGQGPPGGQGGRWHGWTPREGCGHTHTHTQGADTQEPHAHAAHAPSQWGHRHTEVTPTSPRRLPMQAHTYMGERPAHVHMSTRALAWQLHRLTCNHHHPVAHRSHAAHSPC